MKFRVLVVSFLPAAAMALFPFILVKDRSTGKDSRIIRHEKIHLRQQIEMLVIPFYILYLLNYLVNLLRYRDHSRAYENISFEREAYQNDHLPEFLARRSFWNWVNYI